MHTNTPDVRSAATHSRQAFERSAVRAICALFPLLICIDAHAAENDKITTDRPDYVESSDVVGKDRFQVESSVSVERDRRDGVRYRTFATPILFRFGVSDTVELRLETDGYLVQRARSNATGASLTERGYADTSIGMKWHVLDEQGMAPSVAVLLHADLDTGSVAFRGDGVRPSLRVVAEWELPADYSLGIMPGVSVEKNALGQRFTSASFGVVLGKAFTERFRGFVELKVPQIARGRNGGSQVAIDTGVAYLLSNLMQIDTALTRGMNRNTADLAWTVGFSFKL